MKKWYLIVTKCNEDGFKIESLSFLRKLMCKNRTGSTIKCGHVWELPENSEITNSTLRVKEEDEGVSEFNDFGSKYK